MKEIKLFFVRNYQRFIRFLISFSAIGCILVSSLCVGALSSQPLSFSSATYGLIVGFDTSGNVVDIPTSYFTNSSNTYGLRPKDGSVLPAISKCVLEVPYDISVSADDFWKLVGRCGISYRNSSSKLIPVSFSSLTISLKDDNYLNVFSYSGGSSERLVNFETSSFSSYSGTLTFNFAFSSDITDVKEIYFVLSNLSCVFGSSSEFSSSNISAFLNVIGLFFSQIISFLSSCLSIIVSSPALTVLCLAMPICGFAIILYRRLRHT